jgi:predicted Fe-S protein YdhL (DUF1289 family)
MEFHIADMQSPCINICSLNQQNICVGCYRSIEEITCWSRVNDVNKRKILENAEKRKSILIDIEL